MRPYIFRIADGRPNFGDELNLVLWSHLLPGFQGTATGDGILMGIGTMIKEPMPTERPLIIFGTGAGYTHIPDMTGVDIRFVRGPKTAKALGGVPYITDPAILVKHLLKVEYDQDIQCAFMPHWTTLDNDKTLGERTADVGITLIDPTKPVWEVLKKISRCKKLITEALHGAVVADALGVPWIPTYMSPYHMYKWFDWTQSMEIPYNPESLTVSSLPWIRKNCEPILSSRSLLAHKLEAIDNELIKLRGSVYRES